MLEDAVSHTRWRKAGAAGLVLVALLLVLAMGPWAPHPAATTESESSSAMMLAELEAASPSTAKDLASWSDGPEDRGSGSSSGKRPCITCGAGKSLCFDTCVDLQSDRDNCGCCDKRCYGGRICKSGSCQCDASSTECGGECVNVATDSRHCGRCGSQCKGGTVCSASSCKCPSYKPDTCNGNCTNLASDSRNCATCGTTCTGGRICKARSCQCPASKPDTCSGTCVNLAGDAQNCGVCGGKCRFGSCIRGACTVVPGYWLPVLNNILLTDSQLPRGAGTVAYTYSFWVMLFNFDMSHDPVNILRKGSSIDNNRNPAIFMGGGQAYVTLRIGPDSSGCFPSANAAITDALPNFQWKNIAVTVQEGNQKIYIDGVEKASTTCSGILANTEPLVSSDQFYLPFVGYVGEIKYSPTYLSAASVNALKGSPPTLPALSAPLVAGAVAVPTSGQVLATAGQITVGDANSYTYMFWIKVNAWSTSAAPGRQNVLHKGSTTAAGGGAPALYLANAAVGNGPYLDVGLGNTDGISPLVAGAKPATLDATCASVNKLPNAASAAWVHVAVTVMNGLQIIYFNGIEERRCFHYGLKLNTAPLYINAPDGTYPGIDGSLAEIRYESRFLTPAEILTARAQCPCASCVAQGSCGACNTGFVLSASTCLACPTGCATCNSTASGTCLTCWGGSAASGGVCAV